MKQETNKLLVAVHALDGDMVELMLGLLTDELSADDQRRLAQQFTTVGRLLEQHAALAQEPGDQDTGTAELR